MTKETIGVPMIVKINEFGNDEGSQSVYTYEFNPCLCCEDIKEEQCSKCIKEGSCPMMRATI